MGIKASHIIIGLLIVSALVLTLGNFYNALETTYTQIPENSTNPIKEIGAENLTKSINQTVVAFESFLAPDSPNDILGGLKAATTGGFETLKTVFTAPIVVLKIANEYINIDGGGLIAIMGLILFVLIAFILINLKTGGDN